MTDATIDSSTQVTPDNIKPDEGYDLYGSDDDHTEKKAKALAIVPEDSKEKEAEFGKECTEVPGPPPYTPAVTEDLKKPFWRNKCLILIAVSTVGTLVILVGVLLAILLSRTHKGGSSPSSSAASQPTSSLPSIPSRTISSPSSSTASPSNPSSTAHIGDASAPISNTALAAITVPQQWSANGTIQVDPVSLVQIFFQDSNLYLCSKTSTSGSDTWDLSNSGTRIAPAGVNTPITVASNPAENAANSGLPIRVFFVNSDGYLADIYQSIWGGPWNNGSLSQRQFTVKLPTKGGWYNSVSANWCSGAIVYAQSTDGILYGFEISGDDDQGNGGTWDIAWQKSLENYDEVVNIATVCLPNTGVLFINTGSTDTGQLVSWFNTTSNVSVPLPAQVSAHYVPNSPIAAVYGNIVSESAQSGGFANMTMLLFFPLPSNASSNASLYSLSATPYWSSSAVEPGSDDRYATDEALNWTDTHLTDTNITPYVAAMDSGYGQTLPRAWTPLAMEGQDQGRVEMVFQDDALGIQVTDIIGGHGTYQVINTAN